MISNSLLTYTSISQWLLFLGIALILFGWVEKKEKLILLGQLTFLSIGFLALWILVTDQVSAPEITNEVISKQTKVLAFFKALVWFSGLNVIILLMKILKLRFQKVGLSILLLVALLMFFMVYSIQQMAG